MASKSTEQAVFEALMLLGGGVVVIALSIAVALLDELMRM